MDNNEQSGESVVALINDMECPDAQTISEIINLRKSFPDLDETSLMIKAYMFGVCKRERNN